MAMTRPNTETTQDSPVLRLRAAWKLFGHVTALRSVDLDVYAGQVLAIVGDNGAGKSTLVKALVGVNRLDRGELQVNDATIDRVDPRIMRRLGLSVVFQDLALVETLDVATNMYLGQPIRRGGVFLRKRAMWSGTPTPFRASVCR
jgi:ABC-type sugar transport system ATPase subunit